MLESATEKNATKNLDKGDMFRRTCYLQELIKIVKASIEADIKKVGDQIFKNCNYTLHTRKVYFLSLKHNDNTLIGYIN